MKLPENFFSFIKNKIPINENILLGLSGGPDSLALFYLLLESGRSFGVAHIDHGWRKESAEESSILESLCKEKGILFHLRKLETIPSENIEEKGREERLAFFKQTCARGGYGGVMLGHHADDQAETVLKRIFEGASLRRLRGLSPYTTYDGLAIWRPLLNISKKEIIEWLDKKEISYFSDATNQESRFLRSRMRQELLPLLSKSFGKEISSSLCRLGKAASELDEFLEQLLATYREKKFENESGFGLDLSKDYPKSTFEWNLVVHDFFEKKQLPISSQAIEMVVFHLRQKSKGKRVKISSFEAQMDGGVLTLKKKIG